MAPWHPLRLAEIGIKARQLKDSIRRIKSTKNFEASDVRIYVEQKISHLESNFYPEVCIRWDDEGRPKLAEISDSADGYSLAIVSDKSSKIQSDVSQDTRMASIASQYVNLSKKYLDIQPHDKYNLSVILFNAETSLVQASIEKFSKFVEDDPEIQCDLCLLHKDDSNSKIIYEQLNSIDKDETGTNLASEVAENFLSRLRVQIWNAGNRNGTNYGRPVDLVFLNDVIMGTADVKWIESPYVKIKTVSLAEHIPPMESYEHLAKSGDKSKLVFIACPIQPKESQNYLDAIWCCISDVSQAPSMPMIPARRVNFENAKVTSFITEAHKLGYWVN